MRNNLLKLFLVVSIATLFGCSSSSDDKNPRSSDDKNPSGFSQSDCGMELNTSIWYAAFDKGTYSQAELLIGTSIAANKISGFELDEKEVRDMRQIVDAVGGGEFKGRRIPACLEKINLNYVNAFAGERKSECFAEAYLHDHEFKVFRELKVMRCEDIDTEMTKWVSENKIIGMKWAAPFVNGSNSNSSS